MDGLAPKEHVSAGESDARKLCCVACGHEITEEAARIEVGGGHGHTRLNPAGVLFHFGCFARAPGAGVTGIPVSEHSWFPGCAWQFADCAGCRAHLGWYFTGEASFFGLIAERLV